MKYILTCFLSIMSLFMFSQNIVNGTIKNKQTNVTIAFANVYFPELEKGTISNEDGDFELKNLPNGNYKLVISVIGFKTYSSQIRLPSEISLNVTLSPSAIEMEEVIISTPFHKLQSDNVMKVEQKKITELKVNGLATLSESITSLAGVESVTTGQGIGKPVIRGLSSNRVLVYAQGIRLENQQFGEEHGLGLNDAGVESIEVIKGPASLLYGSDALGGVLYINPEKFAFDNTSEGDFNFNTFTNTKGFSTNLGYKVSSNNFEFIVRGSVAKHADYKTKEYRVTNSRFNENDFKLALGFQKSNFKTDFRYNLNSSELGLPEEIAEQTTRYTPLLPNQKLNNHIFSSKSTLFFENSTIDFNLGYTYNDRQEFEEEHDVDVNHEEENHGDEFLNPALHMKLQTFSYDIKYSLPQLGKFETIIGLQGMNQSNKNYGEEILIPDATTIDVGLLTTSHIHFESLDIQLGIRFDNRIIELNDGFNTSFNSFNGAFGLKTSLLKNITARINLASGFRAPNLAELASDGTHEGTNRYEIGNRNLESEQNFQTDLSLEYKNEHFEIVTNVFVNDINDYIYLAPNGEFVGPEPVYVYLQNDARLYGGEFGIHLHPHPLDWFHIESSYETVIGKQSNSTYLPLIPANTLTNTLRFEFNSKTLKDGYAFVSFKTKFKQNKVGQFESFTNGYNLLSAGLGTTFNLFKHTLQCRLSGNNLTNQFYIHHLSQLKSENIANMGRNFTLGISYKL